VRQNLRSEAEVTRLLNAHVLPVWKDRLFHMIRRSDVAALLDHVEDVLRLYALAGGKGAIALRATIFLLRSRFGWSEFLPKS
jgi:hypothetical protein